MQLSQLMQIELSHTTFRQLQTGRELGMVLPGRITRLNGRRSECCSLGEDSGYPPARSVLLTGATHPVAVPGIAAAALVL